jgi:hypothetical protein
MKCIILYNLCSDKDWPEVRKYLSSNAAEEEKKSKIMYRNDYGTFLHIAVYRDAPDDIIKTCLEIGGKELVMKVDTGNRTALHDACIHGASYYIINMLINVGGKDLVMAKDNIGYTALHHLCRRITRHTKVAEIIKLILQVGDANLILSAKNHAGNTPLEIATKEGASKKVKTLLTVQSTTPVADIQMEAAHAQEPLEESNRRAADLEATVKTQRSKIADLSNEKDGMEKECIDRVDKLTRKLAKQQAELQLLKNSSSDDEVGRKRKHTNEEHKEGEGTVFQSQSQSSSGRRVENAANISSVASNTNQAEDDDAAMIAGQLEQYNMLMSQYNMLMSRYMATRRELRSAKAQNVELKQEIDDLAI